MPKLPKKPKSPEALLTRHDRAAKEGRRYETLWREDKAGLGPKLIKLGGRELCRPSDHEEWLTSREVKRP